jgi:2-polyprenyl-3-methyl-5-hydroxy-6-metoxy-1,4-benzoquinol methylase
MLTNATVDDWTDVLPPEAFLTCGAPVIATEEVAGCPICGHDQFGIYTVGFDYELLTCRNPWRFVRCEDCGHVWLNPRPALSALPTIYPSSYYAYNYKQQINSLAVRAKALLDRFKMSRILRRLPHPPKSYLDIGCGDGRFLKLMEQHGVARQLNYGLELDKELVRSHAASGYQVFCERAEDCERISADCIDLVTMFHVIEHIDDPAALTCKVAGWLAPGGIFAVETPNLESLDARWFRERYWGGYHIPRHWNLFTPASLARLLSDAGLRVLTTIYQTGHSFWMYSFHHRLRYGPWPHKQLARWFNPLNSLLFLTLFTAFDKLRAALSFRTSSMLVLAQKTPLPSDSQLFNSAVRQGG